VPYQLGTVMDHWGGAGEYARTSVGWDPGRVSHVWARDSGTKVALRGGERDRTGVLPGPAGGFEASPEGGLESQTVAGYGPGMATMRIGINTGGGDAPGLNAVIRAVVLSAEARGWEVLGIRHGYRGLIEDDPDLIVRLNRSAVRGITHVGGTILGSTNRGDPFSYPVKAPNGDLVPTDVSERIVRRARELGLDAFVAIGGDGSMRLATRLLERGFPPIMGVPKTIDNDLPGTDVTFGFETAVSTATDALDRLHSTAQSHERVMVVEVMGRYAGWIALYSGVAGSADVILIPEVPFDIDTVCDKVRLRESRGRRFSIVVVAEGAKPCGGERVFVEGKDPFKEHARLGGIAEQVAALIQERTGKETRSLVLGHLQRGGAPVTRDRLLALRLGCAATRFLQESVESGMVAVIGSELKRVPLEDATSALRTVPADSEVLKAARELGLCFGDEGRDAFKISPTEHVSRPPGSPSP
jgi:ATP-dependent phosphofructokinase / diphosphate-dependent phosphofructokinase